MAEERRDIALSLWQPWASLIALGHKTIETRGWPTAYRGQLWIHATKETPDDAYWMAVEDHYVANALRLSGITSFVDLPRGAMVGVCELVGCIPTEHVAADPFGDFSPGRWAWLLEDCRALRRPVPARGRQGLWEWTDQRVAEVGR